MNKRIASDRTIALALIATMASSLVCTLGAFEPFQVDVMQSREAETSKQIDHLLPLRNVPYQTPPEFPYLAQYWAQIPHGRDHYVVAVRDDTNSRIYIEEGEAPKQKLYGRPYRYKNRVEISADTATLIYEVWVNVLLETRPDRRAPPLLLGAPLYILSTYYPGLGYMHGVAYTAEYPDMPPRWIVEAGEDLYSFVTTMPRDENELRAKIQAKKDAFYQYMRTHPCP